MWLSKTDSSKTRWGRLPPGKKMRSRKLLSFLDELNFLDWGYRFNAAALRCADSMSVHEGVFA